MWWSVASKDYEGKVRQGDVVTYSPHLTPPEDITSLNPNSADGFVIVAYGGCGWQSVLQDIYVRMGPIQPLLHRQFPDDSTIYSRLPSQNGFFPNGTVPPNPNLEPIKYLRPQSKGNLTYQEALPIP
jgi:hypothetical protein